MSAAADRSTRRRFLGWAGAGAASLAAGLAHAAETPAVAPAAAGKPVAHRFALGVVSYTFKDFPLEKALAMTNRVGLKHICLKSMHLPLDSTPEAIARVVQQVKAAGLDLYGGGVINMHTPAEVNQAFDYAKAAGMGLIVAMPTAELLPLLDEKVRAYDIRVAIHNHGPGDKNFPTPESAYRKIEKLDPRVGLCMDIGHTVRIGADPVRAAKRFADRLLDVHLKDVLGGLGERPVRGDGPRRDPDPGVRADAHRGRLQREAGLRVREGLQGPLARASRIRGLCQWGSGGDLALSLREAVGVRHRHRLRAAAGL